MITARGMLEILQLANDHEPKSFNDFTKILIKKKRLSSATVSKRIDELIIVAAIEEVVIKSKTERRIIAYRTTDKGRKLIKQAKELKKALSGLESM